MLGLIRLRYMVAGLIVVALSMITTVVVVALGSTTATSSITGTIIVAPAPSNVIVNHTNFHVISNTSAIAQRSYFFAHASVGDNIVNGFNLWHADNATSFPLIVVNEDDVPSNTITRSTQGMLYNYSRGNPGYTQKIDLFESCITNGWGIRVRVVMNKFCYIDHDGDWTAYRDSMVSLEQSYPDTLFIYATMPITIWSTADNIAINNFNNNLRQWISTQHGKYLYDIADIEAYNPDGVQQTFSSGGATYQKLWTGYSSDGGHPDTKDAEKRLASGLYALFGLLP